MEKEFNEKRKEILNSLERGDKMKIAKMAKCTYPSVRSAFKKEYAEITDFDIHIIKCASRFIKRKEAKKRAKIERI